MYKARGLLSQPIGAKEERKGPPRSDQGLFKAKPRSSHVTSSAETCPPPPVPTFLLAQNLRPKDIAGRDITR